MKIQITQALPNGQVTQQVVVTKGGQPVKVQVQPNSKLSFDIESTGTKETDAAKVKATDIKRVGNSLILEAEGEALVEVVDFYSASGSSVGDITWNYVSPDFAAVTTTPEAQALAVAESSSLVAGVPIWLGVSSAAVVVAAAGGGGGGGSGNSNAAGSNGADVTPPTITISDNVAATTTATPVLYTFTFSEAVTGFDASKLTVTGGTAGTFTKINDTTYTLVVTPTANATGNIVVTATTTGVSDLAANAMVQTTGLSSTQAYNTTTPVVDSAAPTVVISDGVSATTATGPVQYTFTFSEAVSGFTASNITVTGGVAGTLMAVNDHTFTLVVTPTAATASNIVVTLATSGVSDLAGNAMVQTTGLSSTQAYDTTTPVVDTTAPTLVITDDESAATATGPVLYTFTFSEAVSGFDASKVSVTGGTAGTFTKINDSTYTLVVTPTAASTGNIVVTAATTGVSDLAANAMVQTTGLSSTQAYDTTAAVADTTAPTVVISDSVAAATANGPVQYTFTFSEAVSGFDIGKINVTGGTAGTFTVVNDHTFTLVVTPTAATASNIVVTLATSGVSDLAGNAMVQTTGLSSTQAYDTTTPVVDTTAPTLVITDDESAATATGPVLYTFTFSEAVSGFDASKVSVTGGTAGTFTKINDSTYTLVVTPTAASTGNIVVTAATTGVSDLAANAMVQTTGLTSTQAYDTTTPVVDTTAPTVVISDSVAAATANGPVQYTFTFSEAVSGFDIGKINVTGGTAGTFTVVNDHTFTLVVTPTAATASNIVVTLATSGVSDLAGNAMVQTTGLSSTQAYDTTTPVVDTTAPTLVITDDESAATATGPVLHTFTFSEAVSGFDASKVSVTGGTAGTFTKINDSTYTLVVTPTAASTGNIVVTAATTGVSDLAANAMVQTTGLTSTQAYDTQNSTPDTTAPTVVITDNIAVVTASGPVQYTFTFSEAVSNFDISKINVTGGTAGILTAVNDRTFTLVVTPTANATGNIVVSMLTTGVSDLANNAMVQTTGLTSTQAYDTTAAVADTTPPTLTISDNAAAATVTGPVQYTFTFSEAVSDFDVSKITVTGGTIGELTLVSSTVYQLVVTPTNNATGNITVSVAAATVHDLANNALAATTSATVHAYDTTSTLWSVAALADSVNEDAGTISYVITRTGNGAAATIDFSTGGGTATAGSDYTAVSQTVSFAAGELSKTIQVALTNDTVAESNETVLASISNASVGSIATSTATATILDNDQSIWSVGVSPTSVDESAGFISYTVSRTGATGASTIVFNTGGGTATAGSDYTDASQTLSFAAGEMTKTVQVAIADDTVAEGNETLGATISNASQGSIATGTVATTILDNEQSVWSIASATATADEGVGFITYTVSRTGATGAATLAFATGGGTATAGSDYTAVSQTLTFAEGETSKTVQVAIADDTVAESNETVVAVISTVNSGSLDDLFSNSTATSTILDNDQSNWSVAASTPSVDEGGSFITYTVSRTGASGAATIAFATGGGTATAGSDYTAVSQTLSFAAGEMTKTVQVALINDTVSEANETVTAVIASASQGNIPTNSATATILDNDQSIWSVAAATPTVDEGAGFISYTVSRTGSAGAATIAFATAGGTATAGSDYTAASQTLTFAAGEMSKTVQVAITDDTVAESNETVTGSILNASVGSIATNSGAATIVDNEQSNWSITATTPSVDEGAGFVTYTVSRTGATGASTVDFATAGGTATGGSDYTAVSQTLTFAVGEMSKTVQVAIADDTLAEVNETFGATIRNVSQGNITTGSAATTIVDNDQTAWFIGAATAVVDEGAGYISYTVSRTGTTPAATIVFSTGGGSATAGSDYTALSQTLTFAAGESSKTVLVAITDDTVLEANESVTASLSAASVGNIVTSSASATITDNDQSVWSIAGNTVDEGAGFGTFVVSRTGSSAAETITFSTGGGTATAGSDYTAVSQVLTFAAGEMTKTVLVPIVDDTLAEGGESFVGTLSTPSHGTLGTGTATLTITDNELTVWSLTTSGSVVGTDLEGQGFITYTLTRTGGADAATIRFATSNGTATAGVDFVAVDQVLTFAAGEMRKTVLVEIINDTLPEINEYVLATITDASTGTSSGVTASFITDDDQALWTISAGTATESAGFLNYVVTRTGVMDAATISFYTNGGAATAGSDYVPVNQVITFAAGEVSKTVQVAILNDTFIESSETVLATISTPSSGSIYTGLGTGSGTITDDDDTSVLWGVSAATGTVGEGAGYITYTVTRSSGTGAATINFATTGGTATAGLDYTAVNQTLTFADGEMTQNVLVAIADDTQEEVNETVIASISVASTGPMTTASATATIQDNDQSLWSVSGTGPGGGNAAENSGSVTFVVSRSGATNVAAAVDFYTNGSFGATSATAGLDYVPLSQTISFAAGESSKLITVDLIDDTLSESSEIFEGRIANASTGTIVTGTTSTYVIQDNEASNWSLSASGNADEGGGYATYTVTRSGAVDAAATITFSTVGGTATLGSDYTGVTQVLTFAAGENSKTVQVAITDDVLAEGNETFSAILTNASNGMVSSTAIATTILDNDSVNYTLASGGTFAENTGSMTYTVTRSGNVQTAGTVDWAVAGGTAQNADLTGALSGTLSFAAGEQSKTITLAINDDSLTEASETVVVALSNATSVTGAPTLGTATASNTITDNDGVSYAIATGGTFQEADGSMSYVITRSGNLQTSGTVNWAVSGGTAQSADLSGALSGTVSFAAGELTKVISLGLNADSLGEADETVVVALSSPTSASGGSSIGTATASNTIADDDQVRYAIGTAANVSEADSSGFTYYVTRSGNLQTTGTVDWAIVGNQVDASDLTGPLSGTVTFAAGEVAKAIHVGVFNDTLSESTENVIMYLTNPTSVSGAATITGTPPTPAIWDDDRTVINTQGGGASFSEASGVMTFNITRDVVNNTQSTATVDWAITGGTAQVADFTGPLSGTVTFAAGEVTKVITIGLTNDTLVEADESVILSLSNATSSTGVAHINSLTAQNSIVDDDQVRYAITGANTVDEGAGKMSYTVTRSGNLQTAGTVDWAVAGGTAQAADLSGVLSGTVTFAAGEATKTIWLDVTDDALSEADETVVVALSSATSAAGTPNIGTATATNTIADNEQVRFAVAANTTIDEGAGQMSYTVNRTGNLQSVASVDWSVVTNNADLSGVLSGSLTFAAGEQSKVITLNVLDDSLVESDETVLVVLNNATSTVGSATISATTVSNLNTITDNDQVRYAITAGASTGGEGAGYTYYTVTRSGNLQSAGSVDWAVTGGTASTADLSGALSGTVTFAAGEQTKTIVLGLADDALSEADETVIVALSGATSAVGAPTITTATATNTIADNDQVRYVVSGSSSVDEATGKLAYTVTRGGNLQAGGTVDWSVAGGTAQAADLSGTLSGTLTFAAGEGTKTIVLDVVDDGLSEADETVVVVLSGATSTAGTPTIVTASVSGTILDNDQVRYAITGANTVDEGAGKMTYTVTRSGNLQVAGTVDWALAGGTSQLTDYSGSLSGTLSFAAGEQTKVITLAITDDTLGEANETAIVVLGNATSASGAATISTNSATNTINDNDMSTWVVGGNSTATGVDESSGKMAFAITRTGNLQQVATIDYGTTGAAASGNAIAGKDYTAASGTLTFAAGEQTKTVWIDVTDDTLAEATETVFLGITNASAGTITTSNASLNVFDNDLASWAVAGAGAVDEGTGKMAFTITRTGNLQQAANIDYSTIGGTASGTAIAGKDYTAVAGTLSFAAGEQVKTVWIDVTNDTLGEAAETVTLGIANVTAGTIATSSATNSITDNDLATWAVAGVQQVDEGAGKMAFTITRTGNLQQVATIDYSNTGAAASTGNAIAGKDYTAVAGTLTFGAGEQVKTVWVDVTNDTLGEAAETVFLGITNASVGTITTASASNNITDNDLATWAVGSVGAALENTGLIAYTVTRSGNLQQTATIDYSTMGGTAINGLDYVSSNGTLTFAAGEQTKVVYISLTDDSLAEGAETIGLSIGNASVGTISTATITGSITDNDVQVASFAVGAVQASTWEGAGYALFSITRTGDVQGTQTVYFDTTTAGTASSGTDFTAAAATAYTFAPGETVKVVKVAITQDASAEPNETITGRIGGLSSGIVSTATTNITILDDDGGTTGYDGNAAAPSFALAFVQTNAWEGSGYAYYSITRSGDVTGTQTVDFATNGVGTATAGTDFTAVTATTYTFAPGETVKVVKVAITQDATTEVNETVQGVISNATGGATLGTATANVSILDDDGGSTGLWDGNATAPAFAIAAVQASTWEGAGYALYSITRTGDLAGTQTVDFATGVAGTAVAGTDFTAVPTTTYTFAPGETMKVVKVAITQDATAEANKTIQGLISNATGGATLGTSTINVTILDDDGGTAGFDGNPTAPAFAIGTTQATVFEGTGLLEYTVTRTNDYSGTQTVNYAITGGTATAGTDFTTTSGTLTFAPGEVTKTFTVAMIDNSVWEGNETVIATISGQSAGTIGTATATITMADTDVINDGAGLSTTFVLGTTSAANTGMFINGLDGTDTFTINTSGIYAQVDGGLGDDIFNINAVSPLANGSLFNGGDGVDTLNISAGAVALLLNNTTDSTLRGFERVNFGATTGTPSISLGLEDVLQMTTGNSVANTLRFDYSGTVASTLNLQTLGRTLQTPTAGSTITDVDGSSLSVVATSGVGAQNNAAATDVVIGGRTYDVYQYDYNSQTMTLLIDTAITKVVI